MSPILALSFERNANEPLPLGMARVLHDEVGFRRARVWANACSLMGAVGMLDYDGLHALDQVFANFAEAGFEPGYLNVVGWPSYATDTGKCSWHKYGEGPYRFELDAAGNAIPGSARFDGSLDWVKNPSRVRPEVVRWMAEQLTERYYCNPIERRTPQVIYGLGCTNEFALGDYNPLTFALDPHFDEAYRQVIVDIVRPFWLGMHDSVVSTSLLPPLFIGPDAAYVSDLSALLDTQLFRSIVSIHGYPSGDPKDGETEDLDGALHHLDRMVDAIVAWAKAAGIPTPEIRMTEIGVEDWLIDYLRIAPQRHPEITWWTLNGPENFAELSDDRVTWRATELGRKVREVTAGWGSNDKRRSVQS